MVTKTVSIARMVSQFTASCFVVKLRSFLQFLTLVQYVLSAFSRIECYVVLPTNEKSRKRGLLCA